VKERKEEDDWTEEEVGLGDEDKSCTSREEKVLVGTLDGGST